jgi:hypothetical protein
MRRKWTAAFVAGTALLLVLAAALFAWLRSR